MHRVLTAIALAVALPIVSAYGQENAAAGAAPRSDDSPFRRLEAMVWLADRGIASDGGKFLEPMRVPARETAPYLEADVIRLGLSLDFVEAVGNVVLTTTREDGSAVTIRADRITIDEKSSRP